MRKHTLFLSAFLLLGSWAHAVGNDHRGAEPIGEVSALSISRSIDAFGVRYFKAISEKVGANENVMASGINMARLLLTAAMTNDEKEQNNILKPIFGRNLTPKEIESVYAELPKLIDRLSLNEKDMKTALEAALFTKSLSAGERAEMEALIHGKVSDEVSRTKINKWVAEKTNNLIPQLLSNEPQGDVLVSTLYFKLPWKTPFTKDRTRDAVFKPETGVPYKTKMMRGKAATPYYESTDYKFMSLPFRESADKKKQYHCDFYMPGEGKSFDGVFKDLQSGEWRNKLQSANAELTTQLAEKNHRAADVAMGVNRIKLETSTPDPKALLRGLGLDRLKVLGQSAADVVEKGAFIMDEEGAEGAMAAALVTKGASPIGGKSFYTERPYIMVVRNQDNEIISMVKVNKPNEAPPENPAAGKHPN